MGLKEDQFIREEAKKAVRVTIPELTLEVASLAEEIASLRADIAAMKTVIKSKSSGSSKKE